MQSVKAALKEAQAQLHNISDAPELDAERLMLQVVGGQESSWLYAHAEEALTQEQQNEFEKVVAERAMGKPLAYILGEWEFYGRPFFVNKDVLVPRPETENLVGAALDFLETSILRNIEGRVGPIVIADIGTGSGIIAITLLKELELRSNTPAGGYELRIIATDVSATALAVAKRNAKRHGVEHLIDFRLGNMLEPLQNEKVDLIVSNPPYVPAEELRQLAEAKAGLIHETAGLTFEPRLALDGGPDGLTFVREIKKTAKMLGIPAVIEMTQGEVSIFA